MKRLAWQSGILVAILAAVCIIARVRSDGYTAYIPLYVDQALPAEQGQFTIEVDHDPALDDEGDVTFGATGFEKGNVKVDVHPEQAGDVWADLQDPSGSQVGNGFFHVDRFGTVYDYRTGGFTGDNIVLPAFAAFFLLEGILMLLAFRRAKGAEFYSYYTIYTAGFSLFLILTGITLSILTVRRILHPTEFNMLRVYSAIAASGAQFVMITFPFVLAFAVSMTVSNIALLRHEARRLRNVLGIIISLMMVGGALLVIYQAMHDISGSEQQIHIYETLKNVSAIAFSYFECILIGAITCGIRAARHIPRGDFGYIIILGCGFRKDGSLPPLLRGRVDRALSFWREQKAHGVDAVLIPSGGQGSDETMPEAEAMRRYMLTQDVPQESILPEDRSANTYQNMEFSKKLIEEDGRGGRVVFATTNYHVFRSGVWASLAGLSAEGIGSRTKWWFWPNAFMRECVGLFVNRWKQELLVLLILVGFFGTLSLIM